MPSLRLVSSRCLGQYRCVSAAWLDRTWKALRRRWYVALVIAAVGAVGWTLDAVEVYEKGRARLEQWRHGTARSQRAAFELGLDVAAVRFVLRDVEGGINTSLATETLAQLDANQAARASAVCRHIKPSELMRAADPSGEFTLGLTDVERLRRCIHDAHGPEVARAFRVGWLLSTMDLSGRAALDGRVQAEEPAHAAELRKRFAAAAIQVNEELEAVGSAIRLSPTLTPAALEFVWKARDELVPRPQ